MRNLDELIDDIETMDIEEVEVIDNGNLPMIDQVEKELISGLMLDAQIEGAKTLGKLQDSVNEIERRIGLAASDLERSKEKIGEIDIDSLNKFGAIAKEVTSTDEITSAFDYAYQEQRAVTERAYHAQRTKLDQIIKEKEAEINDLDRQIDRINLSKWIRVLAIIGLILFVLGFSVRWGYMLRNKVAPNPVIEWFFPEPEAEPEG